MNTVPDIWASLPMPALLMDGSNLVLEANAPAEDFLNSPARLLRGQRLWDLLATDPPLQNTVHQARLRGTPLFVSSAELSAGTQARRCSVQAAPLAEHPEIMLLLITPREFGGASRRGEGPRTAVQSAIGMAEMLAHEIKNPLAGITGAAQLLRMELQAEEQNLTDLIVGECQRIVKLLDQVEQFGNLSPPDLRAVNLHDVLDRARQSATLGFASGIEIVEDYDPSLPMAHADADQLLQVVLNLLKNAAEALTPPEQKAAARITLRSYYDHTVRRRQANGSGQPLPLQIEIADTGPGLPADIREEIFDPFVSGRENGTGLGLALVGKIVADHGGWIAVNSVPGRTVFRLSLPRAPEF